MSDFTQLVADCNVPAAVAPLLSAFDVALFARSCTTSAELEELVNHFLAEASVTDAAERFITKASLRLLFCKCRTSEGMASLEVAPTPTTPLGDGPPAATPAPPATPPLSSSWQEAWPAKLSGERTAALRKRFEEDYPTELLDAESFPSARLLALTNKMLSDKEVRWIPWKYRLSARAQEDSLLVRPRKQARFDLTELFLDEAPTRDIHEGPASFGLVTQLLSLAANAIALCQGAHLGSLKLYNKRFMRICFTKYDAAASLRGPTTMEAQAADRRCWEIIADLVNVHHWKLDDALHEVAEVRSDMHSLLAPRPFIPKPKFDPDNSWKARFTGNGRGGKGGGRGGKGRDGKGEKGERFERGGKGGKGKDNKQATPPGKWLSTLFMDGKRQTLCMRYQSGQCKDPATCRYLHRCAETHFSELRDIAEEVTTVPLSVPAQPSGSAGATASLPKARALVSDAASALSEGSLDFATCLELLAQYFSIPFASSSHCPDNAIAASEAYFNLGAFAFDNGSRSGIFQRTEQFSDVLRFLNAFMQLQFPEASWSSLCVSHNVRTRLHTDSGNAAGSLNHTVSLGNFSGGEVWLCPALNQAACQVPAPSDASSEAHSASEVGTGEVRDTWHAPLSFSCEALHCTLPIQGDRWVLTAYTCKSLDRFDATSLAHLRSLGFPLPPATPCHPQSIHPPLKDTTCVELFLDICCGAAHPLTTAMSSYGITCLPIDLLGEEQLDLLNDDTYDHLLRLCFAGIVRLAHGSPPCKEYSRLKLRPGGPPAIRSPDHMNGLPGNTASQQARVQSSQKLLYRCVCLLRAAFCSGAHVSREQPTNAMSWLEPFVQDMLSEIQASLVNIPACSVGQDIAKSWLFACSYSEFRFLASTCSHAGGHQSVAGTRDERGTFLSQRTAEYPSQLAEKFSAKAVHLFSSARPAYSVSPCSLKFALASVPKKPRSSTPTAAQDGGGIYSLPDWSLGPRYQSDSLHDLRKEWQSWLLQNRIPLRLQQHVAEASNKPLFSTEETEWLRSSFKRFSDAHSPCQDWNFSVTEGQPYCLSALERLSTMLGDKDTSLFPALQKGVPTGFDGDIPRSHTLRPRDPNNSDEPTDLLVCEGNWQGAEADPALLQELIEEEVSAGYIEEVSSLEAAYERWGKERVAFSLPSLQDIQSAYPPREDEEPVSGFSLDVKGAHKTSLVREKDRGLLGLRQQERLFFYRVCPFGATFSSHWFARLGGFFVRCLHLLIWLSHVLMLYVDDLLLWQNSRALPLSASLVLAFCACFNIPLSWRKLQMGPSITWIGWQIDFKAGCYTLPELKRLKLLVQVEECLRHRLVSRKQLDKLLGLLQWILHGLPALRPWLCTLYDDMHRPLGTNVSISPVVWPGIHSYLDDKLRFTGCPPGTGISPGSTLLSARHKPLKSKEDLALVPVSTKRMWLRVTDPTSSKRRLCESSRETLAFFAHLSSRDWRPRPLRPPPTSSVESAADAFGKGNDCGVGGWLLLPSGRLLWFAHRYTVKDFLDLGLPMQADANLDISSYETLAQCFVLLAFWKAHGSGRLALTLPALSDNSGAESVCNKLYTSKVPLNFFVRKLSMWSSITGVTLDCSHIAGEKNDDADLLSRWDGSTELPPKFLASNRIELSLSEFWQIRFQVTLFPADTFLKWQLPSADSLGPTNRGSRKRK
ncbi:unnamed protein product [Symbiodinium sp. CCMP2592]|nr:unnamed protein product [Symbiodinium sp. CCMP2592]